MRRAVACMVAVGAAALVASAIGAVDPPTILPWHQVGAFSLGEDRARVEYEFGQRQHVAGPVGGAGYRLHGGGVVIGYDSTNYVKLISVSGTSYYRAADGFGIGYHVPLGPCHRASGACVYRWRGLTYNANTGWWMGFVTWKKARIRVEISTTRGVIDWFTFAKNGTVGKAVPPSPPVRAAIIAFIKAAPAAGCTKSTCHVTRVLIAASDPTYAMVSVSDPAIGGAYLIARRVSGRWRIATGPGSEGVGCGTIPAHILNDFGLSCP